jgi:signal transduction histidine kinase
MRASERAQSPRVWRLARQLTELSRVERGLEQPVIAPVDLAALLRAIGGDHRHVTLEIGGTAPLSTDSRHLAAVLFPVLENALLHGAPPVRLSLDGTEITVTDAGPGFPEDLLPRATERFVTGAPAVGRGVGLGLALAAAHARRIGATLELANTPSHGATVTIRLPDNQDQIQIRASSGAVRHLAH